MEWGSESAGAQTKNDIAQNTIVYTNSHPITVHGYPKYTRWTYAVGPTLCPEDRNEDSCCKGKREAGSWFLFEPLV
jgi:hypothetical protein